MISAYSNHHLLYPLFSYFLLCSQICSFLQIKLRCNYKYRIVLRMIANLIY